MDTTLPQVNEIWIIDDNDIDVLVGVKTIARYDPKIRVRSFTKPIEALSTLRAALESRTPLPELIFLDLYMPFMDGWEFLSKLKEIMQGQIPIRVVVTSSTPNEKEIPKHTEYPEVIGHIIKPIEVARLQELNKLWVA